MPRLRAAGYKYAALPDVVGQKSAQELERAELEATWKQKTADLWANAELEVPQAQARRVQQRERKASRAVTVPLPLRDGATRERRTVTTASPSRNDRRANAKQPPRGLQLLEDRTNRGPGDRSTGGAVTAAQQLPTAAKGWTAANHAERAAKATMEVSSKKGGKKKARKNVKKKTKKTNKTAPTPKLPASPDKPTSQLLLHEVSVGRLGSGGLGRLSHGRSLPVQEQPDEAQFASSGSSTESESESSSESNSASGNDRRGDRAQGGGDSGADILNAAPPRGFRDLERQFRSVEASLPAAEREALADDLQNIAGVISSISLRQSTTNESHPEAAGRATQKQRQAGGVRDKSESSESSDSDDSQESWSEVPDDDQDDTRAYEPAQQRIESQWKLHTDFASGEQFEIHSITQEVRWLGADADDSSPTTRRGTTDAASKDGPSPAGKLANASRRRGRSSSNQKKQRPQRQLPARQTRHQQRGGQAGRSLTRKPCKSSGSERQSARPADVKMPRRKKAQAREVAVHDSGEWGGVETAEERQLRLKAERRKELERQRPVSAESEVDSWGDDDDDDDDGHSDSDLGGLRSDDEEIFESDSSTDSAGRTAPQGRGKRSKRAQVQQVPSDRREKVSSRPVKEFDLSEPGGGRAGRRRGSDDGIFDTTMGFGDEPEGLAALEEKWQASFTLRSCHALA